MKISTIGINIAKRIFSSYGVNEYRKTVLKKNLIRNQVLSFLVNLPKCLVGFEEKSWGDEVWN